MFPVHKITRGIGVVVLAGTVFMAIPVRGAERGGEHGHDASPKSGAAGPSMDMHESMMKGMKEMQAMKPTGNVDHDFAIMMRHHHMQGIRMAEYELKHGKDAKMREMAQKIIGSQSKEIAEFDEWIKSSPRGSAKK